MHCDTVRNLFNTNKYTILYFIHSIFYIASTCFGVISHHLQGADIKISIKRNSNKIGYNRHTYIVISVVQNIMGFGSDSVLF